MGSSSVGTNEWILKKAGELSEKFSSLEIGSDKWRMFSWELGDQRAFEVVSLLVDAREKALQDSADGMREAQLDPIPFQTSDVAAGSED